MKSQSVSKFSDTNAINEERYMRAAIKAQEYKSIQQNKRFMQNEARTRRYHYRILQRASK